MNAGVGASARPKGCRSLRLTDAKALCCLSLTIVVIGKLIYKYCFYKYNHGIYKHNNFIYKTKKKTGTDPVFLSLCRKTQELPKA